MHTKTKEQIEIFALLVFSLKSTKIVARYTV